MRRNLVFLVSILVVSLVAGMAGAPVSVGAEVYPPISSPQVANLFEYRAGAPTDQLWTYPATTSPQSVSGTYSPIVGLFGTDLVEDILWYTPSTGGDSLWDMHADGTHTSTLLTGVPNSAVPVAGHFKVEASYADHRDDVLWYRAGKEIDYLWDWNNDGSITTSANYIGGTYTPIVGRFNYHEPTEADPTVDLTDDIVWVVPGGVSHMWNYKIGETITKTDITLGSPAQLIVFAGDGKRDHVFTYRPGAADDFDIDLYTYAAMSRPVGGTFTPVVGRFHAGSLDPGEDILWYAPGKAADYLWDMNCNSVGCGPPTVYPETINGTYRPTVGPFDPYHDDRDSIVWYNASTGVSPVWRAGSDGAFSSVTTNLLPGAQLIAYRLPGSA